MFAHVAIKERQIASNFFTKENAKWLPQSVIYVLPNKLSEKRIFCLCFITYMGHLNLQNILFMFHHIHVTFKYREFVAAASNNLLCDFAFTFGNLQQRWWLLREGGILVLCLTLILVNFDNAPFLLDGPQSFLSSPHLHHWPAIFWECVLLGHCKRPTRTHVPLATVPWQRTQCRYPRGPNVAIALPLGHVAIPIMICRYCSARQSITLPFR